MPEETEGGFYANGEVPIKKEYLLKPTGCKAAVETVTVKEAAEPVDEDPVPCCEDAPQTPAGKKARLAGIAKSSRAALGDVIALCRLAAQRKECDLPACRFSHDVEAYLAGKPEDLGDDCPIVKATGGHCRFGVQCRFASGHPAGTTSGELVESKPVIKLDDVRKKRIEFPRADAYLASISGKKAEEMGPATYPFGERKRVDFTDKLYLAPLTTVGNLPFRRICKEYGVDVTCSEMAMVSNLLKGQSSEWALLKRHPSEDLYGVQVCGGFTDTMTRAAELIDDQVDCDFIDVNMGCPIDLVFSKGMGSGLMERTGRVQQIVTGMATVMRYKALTVKMRMGIADGKPLAHKLIPRMAEWGATALTVHGRTRQQRYTKEADWSYISSCVDAAKGLESNVPCMIGNGDVMSWEEYEANRKATGVSSVMIGRGALVKPWIFTEIKERRHWDIASSERFEMLRRYASHALEHFGTDSEGVEKTRRFLLEWLSFLCRYVPVGLLEVIPQKINHRPPAYYGRDELETLMASDQACDWVTLSERILGKAPEGFKFQPKHKSNSYGTDASTRQSLLQAKATEAVTISI